MGIDLKAGGRRVGHKSSSKVIKTQNPYTRLLIKLYSFLSRRTDSKFCATVLKRLHMSKVNSPPIALSRLAKYMNGKDGKIAVIVGKVTDDIRLMEVRRRATIVPVCIDHRDVNLLTPYASLVT